MEPQIAHIWSIMRENFPEELIICIFTLYKEILGIPTFHYEEENQVQWRGKYTIGSVGTESNKIWLCRPYSVTYVSNWLLQGEVVRDEFQKSLEYGGGGGGNPFGYGNFCISLDVLVYRLQKKKSDNYYHVIGRSEWEEYGMTAILNSDWSLDFSNYIVKLKLQGNDWCYIDWGGEEAWLLHDIDSVIGELLLVKKYCKAECAKWFTPSIGIWQLDEFIFY